MGRSIRIVKPADVRKVAQRCINSLMASEEIDTDKARAISTLLNTSLKAMQQGDLEARLEKIEELINEREGGFK